MNNDIVKKIDQIGIPNFSLPFKSCAQTVNDIKKRQPKAKLELEGSKKRLFVIVLTLKETKSL